jgi:hypothetical protein
MPFVVRLAGQGAIPVEVIRDALAAGVRVDRAILAAIPAGAPSPLGFVIVRALAHGTRDEMLDAFEAALRIGARAAAMRWLAATRGALAEEARARLAAFDREPA